MTDTSADYESLRNPAGYDAARKPQVPGCCLAADGNTQACPNHRQETVVAACCVCDADLSHAVRLVWTGQLTSDGRRICRLLCPACLADERYDAMEQAL